MEDRKALHAAARRYCMDRSYQTTLDFWERIYRGAPMPKIITADINKYWGFFADVLFSIEQTVPNDFFTVKDLKIFLDNIGCSVTDYLGNEIHQSAIAEQLLLFNNHILQLSSEDLEVIEPYAYRRYLNASESDRIWWHAHRKWGVRNVGYWYPLKDVDNQDKLLALQHSWFAHEIPLPTLHSIMKKHQVWRIWEMTERLNDDFGKRVVRENEKDITLFVPESNGYEKYWTSEKRDWIIYTSHENSITIGGAWLIDVIKTAWPLWHEHIYHGPVFNHPPLAAESDAY